MNPLKPTSSVLCKLGSLCIHIQEATSDKAHAFDIHAINATLRDPEINEWLIEMDKLALLPKKR